jgi:hypothetical protein
MKWCVLIIAIDFGLISYKEDSLKVLKDYFTRKNIEYFIQETPPEVLIRKSAHPAWAKLLAHSIVPGYDFIIVWDLDLLPKNKDVDIIQHFDMNKLCLAWDTFARFHHTMKNAEQYLYSYKTFKYNTGLIGLPSHMSSFFEEIFIKYAPGRLESYEQYYVNDEIYYNKIDICELPDDLNCFYNTGGWKDSRLIHYTGSKEAKDNIKVHVENYFNS